MKGMNAPPHAWKKGQSGNPKGRPRKGKTFTETLRSLMIANKLNLKITTKRPGEKVEIQTFDIEADQNMYYALSMTLIHKSLEGDVQAINTIFDRLEGKPLQTNLLGDIDDYKNLSLEEKRGKLIELFGNADRVA